MLQRGDKTRAIRYRECWAAKNWRVQFLEHGAEMTAPRDTHTIEWKKFSDLDSASEANEKYLVGKVCIGIADTCKTDPRA